MFAIANYLPFSIDGRLTYQHIPDWIRYSFDSTVWSDLKLPITGLMQSREQANLVFEQIRAIVTRGRADTERFRSYVDGESRFLVVAERDDPYFGWPKKYVVAWVIAETDTCDPYGFDSELRSLVPPIEVYEQAERLIAAGRYL